MLFIVGSILVLQVCTRSESMYSRRCPYLMAAEEGLRIK